MRRKLDTLALKIIYNLQKDGRASITELAEKVESSRPTVTSRLKQLMEDELVVIKGGLNLRKFDFETAHVGLEVKTDDTRNEVERFLKKCPRVLSVYKAPEKANFNILMWGETPQTLNSTIESFRDFPNVEIVYIRLLGTPIHGDIITNVELPDGSETPCEKICSSCHMYNNKCCLGCPLTVDYKNPFIE